MQTAIVSRKAVGVQVDPSRGSRTLRMRLVMEDSEVLHIEFALPTATRLTDQLVDAEFQERRAAQCASTEKALSAPFPDAIMQSA